jgi:hypothetical protein
MRRMGEALRAVIASGGSPFAESRSRLLGGITALLAAGAQAGRLLDLIMDGMRFGAGR